MKLKKLFAGILAVAMMATMAAPAFAATSTGKTDKVTVTNGKFNIVKNYTLTNEGTESPAEIFKLYQVGKTGTNMGKVYNGTAPDLIGETVEGKYIVGSVSFDKADTTRTKNFEIELPNYTGVGVFTYTLKELAGDTKGVTYDPATFVVTVYVFQGETDLETEVTVHDASIAQSKENKNKLDSIDNAYSAGSLTVTKVVKGSLGDKSKNNKFTMKVTFKKPTTGTVSSEIIVKTNGVETGRFVPAWDANDACEKTIEIAHDENVTFENIPYGVTYTVVENDYTGEEYGYQTADYKTLDASADGENGTIDSANETVTVTNVKEGTVDTGVILDNAPYIALMLIVVAGAAVMVIKKRRHYED